MAQKKVMFTPSIAFVIIGGTIAFSIAGASQRRKESFYAGLLLFGIEQ